MQRSPIRLALAAAAAALLAGAAHAHDEEEERSAIAEAHAKMEEAAKEVATIIRRRVRGEPDRAFLGVVVSDDESGVRVVGVSPDGGAEAAGLEVGDVLIDLNGVALVDPEQLIDTLAEVTPGDGVAVNVIRDGESLGFDITTTPYRPGSGLHLAWDADDFRDMLPDVRRWRFRSNDRDGLRLEDVGEDLGDYFGVDAGVLVLDAPPMSELKPGDIVTRIDGDDVASAREAYGLLRRPDDGDATVEVRRKNRKLTVAVPQIGGRASWHGGILRHSGHDDDVEVEVEEAEGL